MKTPDEQGQAVARAAALLRELREAEARRMDATHGTLTAENSTPAQRLERQATVETNVRSMVGLIAAREYCRLALDEIERQAEAAEVVNPFGGDYEHGRLFR